MTSSPPRLTTSLARFGKLTILLLQGRSKSPFHPAAVSEDIGSLLCHWSHVPLDIAACSGGRIVSWIIYCWLVWCERKTLFLTENLRSFTSKRTCCYPSTYFLQVVKRCFDGSSCNWFHNRKTGSEEIKLPRVPDHTRVRTGKRRALILRTCFVQLQHR